MDIFIYDFRGFGRSDGPRRIKAMMSDYAAIAAALRRQYGGLLFIYGYSFGGVIALNAVSPIHDYDAIIIDSVEGEVESFGCPAELNPFSKLPKECSKVLLITGTADHVVKTSEMRPLLDAGEACHAEIIRGSGWGHPFQDESREFTIARDRAIRGYLARKIAEQSREK